MPSTFEKKKNSIVARLQVPDFQYSDLSPKGTMDVGIRPLVHNVNSKEGLVTTSSCAGRVSVFLEGTRKKDSSATAGGDGNISNKASVGHLSGRTSVGGKGPGGRWLYVSHDPIPLSPEVGGVSELTELFGLSPQVQEFSHSEDTRYVHFKFEPMILHVLAASLKHAQSVLSAALQAGFRESGAINITSNPDGVTHPMVAVRSMGLAFDSIIGYSHDSTDHILETPIFSSVGEQYLRSLVEIGNVRFQENARRIKRFAEALDVTHQSIMGIPKDQEWEDADTRRERKRAEGMKKRLALQERGLQNYPVEGSDSEEGTTLPIY
ncbi:hypothetical protein GP486_001638 [Trichoglossum hirsutum]|uniref:tRNA(Phe) 7-[(3-amino-3-carboxypropyl)-4-demethylwyosine(37)-N(4)]-methyltransferase n=1 Tax=Trichoglossum hirsutum TaxID=265104 RepID=A0A9P8RSG6_9PEZI|nr:hypothetical protein GP486_001638 [Trichoglossum hirsutum]